ncbi:MAG: translation initiation factor IF-3 [Anaeroplasmataceae bacterium]
MINDQIKCKELLVITNTGEKLGKLSRNDALKEADMRGLDLVLVSPDANPPVAKLMDYSKFRFEQQKKAKEMKKNQKVVVVQEIRLSPTIEKHDFDTKSNNARKMLLKGNKVKVTLRFFGRMIAHQDLGKEVVERFAESLADVSNIESPVKLDGRSLFTVLGPKSEK